MNANDLHRVNVRHLLIYFLSALGTVASLCLLVRVSLRVCLDLYDSRSATAPTRGQSFSAERGVDAVANVTADLLTANVAVITRCRPNGT